MYTPKVGEMVKVIADSCGHSFRRGRLIRIKSKHEREEGAFWVMGYDRYVTSSDIAQIPKGMRKAMKTFEKSIRKAIGEVQADLPHREMMLEQVLKSLADEVSPD